MLALAGIALLDFLFLHGDGGEEEKGGNRFSWKRSLAEKLGQEVTGVWLPAISFAGQDGMGSGSLLKEILGQQSPLLALGMEGGMEGDGLQTESTSLREKFLLQEGAQRRRGERDGRRSGNAADGRGEAEAG